MRAHIFTKVIVGSVDLDENNNVIRDDSGNPVREVTIELPYISTDTIERISSFLSMQYNEIKQGIDS